jgi:diguanylate cyclase (GGDEF)-like protein
MGMSGGTSAIYAAHGRTVLAAISCILLPPTLHLIWQADMLSLTLAIGGILLVVATTSSVRMLNAALRRSIVLAQQLDRQARVDALSGLANRRALMEAGSAMLANAGRTGRACAALMIDVDHFKRVNDTRGHAAGDAVIAATGALLSRSVRAGELAGRIGGEEFAILLPDGGGEQAVALATRILERVRSTPVAHADGPISVTVSIGVAIALDGTLQALLERADQALYRAKSGGRDRVATYDSWPAGLA